MRRSGAPFWMSEERKSILQPQNLCQTPLIGRNVAQSFCARDLPYANEALVESSSSL